MGRWLVEIGTPNGLRNRAFVCSSSTLPTKQYSVGRLAWSAGFHPAQMGSKPIRNTKIEDIMTGLNRYKGMSPEKIKKLYEELYGITQT